MKKRFSGPNRLPQVVKWSCLFYPLSELEKSYFNDTSGGVVENQRFLPYVTIRQAWRNGPAVSYGTKRAFKKWKYCKIRILTMSLFYDRTRNGPQYGILVYYPVFMCYFNFPGSHYISHNNMNKGTLNIYSSPTFDILIKRMVRVQVGKFFWSISDSVSDLPFYRTPQSLSVGAKWPLLHLCALAVQFA